MQIYDVNLKCFVYTVLREQMLHEGTSSYSSYSNSFSLWMGKMFRFGELVGKVKVGRDVLVSRPVKPTSHEALSHYHVSPEGYKVGLIL